MASIASVIGLDLRSLALLRMGLGATMLVDLADRARLLTVHYTDAGVFPRSAAAASQGIAHWSLHLATGSTLGMGILFAVAAVFAILLLLGWRTRLVTVVCWLLVWSLQQRATPVNYGADALLRTLLFYAMFLPTAARWSIDAARRGPQPGVDVTPPPDQLRSWATAALTIQMGAIYFFTGIQKLADPSWQKLSSVYYALTIEHHATGFALWLSQFYVVTQALTLATLVLEIVVPLFLFIPLFRWQVRVAVILSFIAFHIATAACLHVGYFPWISALGWLALLPAEVWERWRVSTRPGVQIDRSGVRNSLAAAGLALGLATSIHNSAPRLALPDVVTQVSQAIGMEQRWNMFIKPLKNGWFVVPAKLASGKEIDALRRGAPLSWTKPGVVADQFQGMRSRKYFVDMTFNKPGEAQVRALFLRYVCRSWNARTTSEDERMRSVDVVFMEEAVHPDGQRSPPRPRTLAHYECKRAIPENHDSDPYFEMKP